MEPTIVYLDSDSGTSWSVGKFDEDELVETIQYSTYDEAIALLNYFRGGGRDEYFIIKKITHVSRLKVIP